MPLADNGFDSTSPAGQVQEVEKHGANGRVYAARILWEEPNEAWNRH